MSFLERYRDVQRSPDGPFSVIFTKPVELILLPMVDRLPIHPNAWTIISFSLKLWAGWLLFTNQTSYLFPLVLAGSLITDGFDGDIARLHSRGSYLGAFLDRQLDRVANCFIISSFLVYLYQSTEIYTTIVLSLLIILGEIWHDSLRTWISLTGGLLENRDPLPAWDEWVRNKGILPFYAQDSLYFALGVGLLIFGPYPVAVAITILIWSSLFYLSIIYGWETLRRENQKQQYWFAYLRWLIIRLLNATIIVGIGWLGTVKFSTEAFLLFYLPWIEFLIFYTLANTLMSESARIPDNPQRREKFIRELRIKDKQFLEGWFP